MADVQAKEWFKAISDIQKVLPVIIAIKNDCLSSSVSVKAPVKAIDARCISDITKVLEDVGTVVADVESFNIPGAIAAAMVIVPDGQKAIADCEASSKALKGFN